MCARMLAACAAGSARCCIKPHYLCMKSTFAGRRLAALLCRYVAPPICAFLTWHCNICIVLHASMHGMRSRRRRLVPLCRCRRAWLPPASTWLFPPRSALHDSGGWYFEWLGYAGSCSPMCASWLYHLVGSIGVTHVRLVACLIHVVGQSCPWNLSSPGLSCNSCRRLTARSRLVMGAVYQLLGYLHAR